MVSCLSQHYDDLRGMRPVGVERGVATWRPMLDVDKAAIYDAAAALGLPHLRDSTDPTCDRGKLRDDWLPAVRAKQPLLPEGLERCLWCGSSGTPDNLLSSSGQLLFYLKL